jgi:GNAT superfamily N-acetyltransferase
MSRPPEKVDAAVTRLQALGAEATGQAADVRDPEATRAALQHAHAAFGDIDVLVSGATGNLRPRRSTCRPTPLVRCRHRPARVLPPAAGCLRATAQARCGRDQRLGTTGCYRRFFTSKKELSAADLDYLVHVDHSDHEAIIAIDQLSGEAVGVARYVRSNDDAEVAELAVTVIDDWQGRGLGRLLLTRLTDRARREGVRRFSAVVLGQNREALSSPTASAMSDARMTLAWSSSSSNCLPNVASGARLARLLREAAAGNLTGAATRRLS